MGTYIYLRYYTLNNPPYFHSSSFVTTSIWVKSERKNDLKLISSRLPIDTPDNLITTCHCCPRDLTSILHKAFGPSLGTHALDILGTWNYALGPPHTTIRKTPYTQSCSLLTNYLTTIDLLPLTSPFSFPPDHFQFSEPRSATIRPWPIQVTFSEHIMYALSPNPLPVRLMSTLGCPVDVCFLVCFLSAWCPYSVRFLVAPFCSPYYAFAFSIYMRR